MTADASGDGRPGAIDAFLLERGATPAEIDRARDGGWLPLLAVDRLLMPGTPRYDLEAAAERAGVRVDVAQRLWRALGFPDVPLGVPVFPDEGVAALAAARERFDPEHEPDRMLRQARVVSSTLARLAAVEADVIAEALAFLRSTELGEDEVALALLDGLDWDQLAWLLDYVHRLQLRGALWRRLVRDGDDTLTDLAIGFADLAGYTELSSRIAARDLDRLLARWDELGHDTVAEAGARVVKTIGDEIMFVGLSDTVARAAVALAARAEQDPELPPVRVGIARGPMLVRGGDYYGPVVNLAARLADLARTGQVLSGPGVHAAMRDAPDLAWAPLGAIEVRDIGTIEVFELSAAP